MNLKDVWRTLKRDYTGLNLKVEMLARIRARTFGDCTVGSSLHSHRNNLRRDERNVRSILSREINRVLKELPDDIRRLAVVRSGHRAQLYGEHLMYKLPLDVGPLTQHQEVFVNQAMRSIGLSTFYCRGCNKLYCTAVTSASRHEGGMYCQRCIDTLFVRCGCCGSRRVIALEQRNHRLSNGDPVCQTCIREGQAVAPADGDGLLYPRGSLFPYDGSYYLMPHVSSRGGDLVRGHGSFRPFYLGRPNPQKPDGLYAGMELEVVSLTDRNQLAEHINAKRMVGKYCLLETDGSLPGDTGLEIVTGHGEIGHHSELARELCAAIHGKARSHSTNCCGLHVHVSRLGADSYRLARMVVFWNSPDNRPLVELVARRYGASFCANKREKAVYDRTRLADLSHNQDRYEMVNLQNSHTVEVRAFRGTTRYETIMACISMAMSTWRFCRRMPKPAQLNTVSFLGWCQSRGGEEAVPLLEYVQRHGPGLFNDGKTYGKAEIAIDV